MTARPIVRAYLEPGKSCAWFKPEGFLGGGLYGEFLKATESARYDRDLRKKLASLDKVPGILKRLREAGFDADAEPRLRRALQVRTTQQIHDLKAAQERIAVIDGELFKQSGYRMFPYQKTGAQWLTLRFGALLADEQGLGKTLETIVALPANVATLVVAPAVAKGVWRGEVKKWRPQIPTRVLQGRDSFRWPKPGEMLITNYDVLPDIHDREGVAGRVCDGFFPLKKCLGCSEKLTFTANGVSKVKDGHLDACTGFQDPVPCPGCAPFLKDAPHGMVLVADEAHYLKSNKAARTQRFRALSESVRSRDGRVWLLTGTPLENAPKELWDVFKAAGIAEEAFGSWDSFVSIFKGKKLKFGGYEWGLPDDEIRERLQRVSLRRMKSEVLPEMPEKVHRDYDVELDAKALRACELFLNNSGRTVDQIASLLEKEELDFQIMSSVRAALATAKIPAMLAFVKDATEGGEPLVVFSAHRAPIDALAKLKGWAVITGDVSSEKKREIEEKFQRGELKGIGLTIRSGGVAITLTRAHQALFVDLDWKPTANLQAEDRLHRLTQTECVVITRLIADHALDQRVMEVLVRKMRLITASVDAASVADDAPEAGLDNRFEDQLRAIREEIACGRAVRRQAESESEGKALDELHSLVFLSKSDERIATQLAEEAITIGLSSPQWDLATRVAKRGRRRLADEPAAMSPRRGKVKPADESKPVAYEKDEKEAGKRRRAWPPRKKADG